MFKVKILLPLICMTFLLTVQPAFAKENTEADTVTVDPPVTIVPEQESYTRRAIAVRVGETSKIKLKNTKSLTWKISNPKKATVSKKGVIKGKKTGVTYVVAKKGGKTVYRNRVAVYKKSEILKGTYKNVGKGNAILKIHGKTIKHGKSRNFKKSFLDKSLSIKICLNDIEYGYDRFWIYFDSIDIHKVHRSTNGTGQGPVFITRIDKQPPKNRTLSYRLPIYCDFHSKASETPANLGKHTIEIVQYEDENPDKKMIFYRKFTIRYK